MKALLSVLGGGSVDALNAALTSFVDAITPDDARGCLCECDYAPR